MLLLTLCTKNKEREAFDIIKLAYQGREHYLPIVSFSGGKDSTVVSIVRRAFNNQSIVHVFGDTTLELPDTLQYISDFKNEPKDSFFGKSVRPRL